VITSGYKNVTMTKKHKIRKSEGSFGEQKGTVKFQKNIHSKVVTKQEFFFIDEIGS
jgi:hypothetical protein